MYKRSANIVFGIIIFLSLIQLAIFFKIIPISNDAVKEDSILVYIFLVIAGSFAMSKFIGLLQDQKPKEEVKIIYKSFDKEKAGPDIIEKKATDKVEKYASLIETGIDQTMENEIFSEILLNNFAKTFDIVQGIVFILDKEKNIFRTSNTYAFYQTETDKSFEIGEGIAGQVAKNKTFLYIDNVPENYITVLSGLGEGNPKFLGFLPIVFEGNTIAIIEFATFNALPASSDRIFELISEKLAPYFAKFI